MNIRLAAAVVIALMVVLVTDLKYRTCAGELTCFLVSML